MFLSYPFFSVPTLLLLVLRLFGLDYCSSQGTIRPFSDYFLDYPRTVVVKSHISLPCLKLLSGFECLQKDIPSPDFMTCVSPWLWTSPSGLHSFPAFWTRATYHFPHSLASHKCVFFAHPHPILFFLLFESLKQASPSQWILLWYVFPPPQSSTLNLLFVGPFVTVVTSIENTDLPVSSHPGFT